jgi:hypothetical protein
LAVATFVSKTKSANNFPDNTALPQRYGSAPVAIDVQALPVMAQRWQFNCFNVFYPAATPVKQPGLVDQHIA